MHGGSSAVSVKFLRLSTVVGHASSFKVNYCLCPTSVSFTGACGTVIENFALATTYLASAMSTCSDPVAVKCQHRQLIDKLKSWLSARR